MHSAIQLGGWDQAIVAALFVAVGLCIFLYRRWRQAVGLHARRSTSDHRFASLFTASPYPIGLFELYSGRVIEVNDRVTRITGLSRDQLIGSIASELPCWENPSVPTMLARRLLDEGAVYNVEVGFRGREGRSGVALVSARLVEVDGTTCVLAAMNDITERKALEQALSHQAFHDDLTQLANRALFSDRVQHAVARTNRAPAEVAVMFLDLDAFKRVNDSLGHAAGDELLRQVATRLQQCVRASDTLARLGGDEFAILVEDVSARADVEHLAERLIHTIQSPFQVKKTYVGVGASIGIAFGDPDTSADALLRNADLAMYMAKAEGKGRAVVFVPDMHAAAADRMGLELDLRSALENGQLEVFYQPIVAIETRRPVSFEALLRWNHPVRGSVPPSVFIPIAEESGMIEALGSFILERACLDCASWHQGNAVHMPTVSVNLSGRQIGSRFTSAVRHALDQANLDARFLVLEITESVLVQHDVEVLATLRALKELGVALAIDDFGTGYSSLAYLQRFPIDMLKIDRSFIQRLGESQDSPLARAVIGLGKSLSLRTIVEGVETLDQLERLSEMGCELAQGYLFGAPQPASKLASAIRGDVVSLSETTVAAIPSL